MPTYRIDLVHEVLIEATAETVYDLVADVTTTGRYSPECVECQWISGARGEIGSRFVGRNRVGDREWEMTCEVVTADRPRSFGWSVLTEAIDRETSVWTFELIPASGGVVLRQTFAMKQPPSGLQALLDVRSPEHQQRTIDLRRARLDSGMRATLEAYKHEAERLHRGIASGAG